MLSWRIVVGRFSFQIMMVPQHWLDVHAFSNRFVKLFVSAKIICVRVSRPPSNIEETGYPGLGQMLTATTQGNKVATSRHASLAWPFSLGARPCKTSRRPALAKAGRVVGNLASALSTR